MEESKVVRVDLTNCRYYMDMHERIRVAFGFSEGYGANWDAFWDFLSTETDAQYVEIVGAETMSPELQKRIPRIKEALDRMKRHINPQKDRFDYVFLPALRSEQKSPIE